MSFFSFSIPHCGSYGERKDYCVIEEYVYLSTSVGGSVPQSTSDGASCVGGKMEGSGDRRMT